MKIRCLIVDDEPLARRVIAKYLESLPAFDLTAQCSTAIEASAWLHENEADLIFLDIQMPGLTGLEMLRTLAHPPQVILTTAYSEYALEGYEYDVLDYLLKPIAFDRFLKAVNRHPLLWQPKTPEFAGESQANGHVLFQADGKTHRVQLEKIDYLEGYGNFVKVWTHDGMLLVSGPMKSIEARLPEGAFVRIHKSFVVRTDAIRSCSGHSLSIQNKTLPVGRAYKLHLEQAMQKSR